MKIIIGIIIYAFIGCIVAGYQADDNAEPPEIMLYIAFWPIMLLIGIAAILAIIPFTIGRTLKAFISYFTEKE